MLAPLLPVIDPFRMRSLDQLRFGNWIWIKRDQLLNQQTGAFTSAGLKSSVC
jgi:hypothetical protein